MKFKKLNEDVDTTAPLDEGAGADTKNTISNILNVLSTQEGSKEWSTLTSQIVSAIPDDLIDDTVDVVKEKISGVQIPEKNKKDLIDTAEQNTDTEIDESKVNTFGDLLNMIDVGWWADEHPDVLKRYIMTVLGIINLIEPGPILEVILSIVTFIPDKIVAKILQFTSYTMISPVIMYIAKFIGKQIDKLKEVKEDITTMNMNKLAELINNATGMAEDAGTISHAGVYACVADETSVEVSCADINDVEKVYDIVNSLIKMHPNATDLTVETTPHCVYISKRDLVNESVNEHQYIIVGITTDGTKMFWNSDKKDFVYDVEDATIYNDQDVAREEWLDIPRGGFRRIFIPRI